jgi:hypothetical protein
MLNTYINLPANPDTDLLNVELADVELARFSVMPYTTMSIAYADLGTAGTIWVADLQWSDNGTDWFAFAGAVQIGPGVGMAYFTPIDVSDCAFVRLVVTTGEGSSNLIRVAVCAKGPQLLAADTNNDKGIDQQIINCTDPNTQPPIVMSSLKFSKMSISASCSSSAAWTSAQVLLEWSNNNVNWQEFPSSTLLDVAAKSYSNLDISTFPFIRFRLWRAETNVLLRLAVCMKSTS